MGVQSGDRSAPGPAYYTHTRLQLIEWMDRIPERVLEVGCAAGNTLARLKSLGARETFGIELDPGAGAQAQDKVDHLLVGDIEQMDLPYEREMFDCLILADVLEHLRDPWAVLKKLVPLVRRQGQVLVSLPNIRFYRISLGLLIRGRWDYRETGILDRTHLRFFTRHSVRELFDHADLRVAETRSVYGTRGSVFNRLTLGCFRDLLATQFFLKAVKE